MKEDILEQLVEDYFQRGGYFTQHNIKFRPRKSHPDYKSAADSVHSDIDLLALHPYKNGVQRVVAVSCKSWQEGFRPDQWIEAIKKNKKMHGRSSWKPFRELTMPKWSEAFRDKIKEMTGATKFTYYLAVTKLKGDAEVWQEYAPFKKALHDNPIKILTAEDILNKLWGDIQKTVEGSEIGRLLQVIKASDWKPDLKK